MSVLLDLARGITVGRIATALSLSPRTITTYRMRLMAKLQVTSNRELTEYALRTGLLE